VILACSVSTTIFYQVDIIYLKRPENRDGDVTRSKPPRRITFCLFGTLFAKNAGSGTLFAKNAGSGSGASKSRKWQ
jgi:hypothetical protein